MKKKVLLGFVAGGLLVVFCALSSYAAPRVTQVDLDTAVTTGYYVAVFDTAKDGTGVWIDPGAVTGDSTTDPTGPALTAGCSAAVANMFGLNTGYGQLLLSVIGSDAGAVGTELGAINANKPTNANVTIFGAATGPVNKINIELSRAIPAGTTVTFTVDMNGEVPHLVAVMGGTVPVVTYNSGTEILTVQTTTFGTTTNNGYSFTSIVGFMIFTDTTLGSTSLRIIAQTNSWVGDIFPLLPGFDSNAAISDSGGTQGTITAKCGTTIYGPVGESRQTNTFFPDSSIEAIFGAGITNTSLAAFANSAQENDTTITRGTSNFGVVGTLATFNYTFASPKDVSIGISGTGAAGIDHHWSWYKPENVCAIATAAYGTPLAEEIKALSIFRDECLLTNKPGRALVSTYERISPPVADFIRDKESLKAMVRAGLKPLVWMANKSIRE